MVKGNPDKADRQARYIDALKTLEGIEIHYGFFLSKPATCHGCERTWLQNEEKKTDVNIAVRVLEDAYDNCFDTALVVSGDSDLSAPIKAVRRRFPGKRVVVAFPPKRFARELAHVADAWFRIRDSNFRESRLPERIETSDGAILTAPQGWLPESG